MIIIKNFNIFRNKKSDNEKAPTHRISIKVGESYADAGAAWTKISPKGDKFLSVKLADAYVDHTDKSKIRKGIVLVFEEDLKELATLAGVEIPLPEAPQKPLKAPTSDLDVI